MIVVKIITTTKQEELTITGATLLSEEEVRKLYGNILKIKDFWWLRSPDKVYIAACVRGGSVDYGLVDWTLGVRPALKLKNLENSDFKVGDSFKIKEHTFTIVSEEYALCDNSIGQCVFRKDWRLKKDANNYETSDVKKYVDNWFEEVVNKHE